MSEPSDQTLELIKRVLEEMKEGSGTDGDGPYEYRGHDNIDRVVAKRFDHLPRETRSFLMSLNDEDIEGLQEALMMGRRMRSMARFFKWTLLVLPLVISAAVTVIDNAAHVIAWMKGAKP